MIERKLRRDQKNYGDIKRVKQIERDFVKHTSFMGIFSTAVK